MLKELIFVGTNVRELREFYSISRRLFPEKITEKLSNGEIFEM